VRLGTMSSLGLRVMVVVVKHQIKQYKLEDGGGWKASKTGTSLTIFAASADITSDVARLDRQVTWTDESCIVIYSGSSGRLPG
jgi:hypothetical protein